eukprot:scaffold108144_cov18-Tisochrysis_lutea.AAC.2
MGAHQEILRSNGHRDGWPRGRGSRTDRRALRTHRARAGQYTCGPTPRRAGGTFHAAGCTRAR